MIITRGYMNIALLFVFIITFELSYLHLLIYRQEMNIKFRFLLIVLLIALHYGVINHNSL